MMDWKIARMVSDVVNEGWITGVSFFGGEPLCNWDAIHTILACVDEQKLRVAANKQQGSVFNITTNGVHLNKERLKLLAAKYVHILLSFDGTPETQNKWRDNSYDEVMKNKELLLKYPSLSVTKTIADPMTYYEDIQHIKELGFKNVFSNYLDPYGDVNYDKYDPYEFKEIYKRTVRDFDSKDGFHMGEIRGWKNIQINNMRGSQPIGDGFTKLGLSVDPDGYYYQCHQAPTLPQAFRIGHVSTGMDKDKEQMLRAVPNAPTCSKCVYRRTQCYVNMYHKHGRFGVDPPEHGMLWERVMIEMYQEITGLPGNKWYACVGGDIC
jgi:radical SAM protein with 4Fe4S-binding SPASM domain